MREVVDSSEADSLPSRGFEGSSSKYQYQTAQPPRVGNFAAVRAAKPVKFNEKEDSAPDTSKASYSSPEQRDFVAVKEARIGDNEKKLRCLLQKHHILKNLKNRRGRENVVVL